MQERCVKSYACPLCPEGKRRMGRVRGQCHGCYRRSREMVRAKLVTWEELAAKGMANLTPEERGLRRNVLFGGAAGGFRYGLTTKGVTDGVRDAARPVQELRDEGEGA